MFVCERYNNIVGSNNVANMKNKSINNTILYKYKKRGKKLQYVLEPSLCAEYYYAFVFDRNNKLYFNAKIGFNVRLYFCIGNVKKEFLQRMINTPEAAGAL